MTDGIDPTALGVLAATPALFRALFDAAGPAAAERVSDGGWSPKHVLAHVLDVDDVAFTGRIRRMVEEDTPYIRSIDPTARIEERGLLARSAASLLEELARQRPVEVAFVRALTPEQLARPGEHDEAGPITPSDIVHQWAYHDLMHLQQAAAMLASGFVERMGNTRRFYDL